jgi:hypothetical protein
MNPSDERLLRELRHLASSSPQGAPPELGARLRGAFARHHGRRRQERIALVATVVVALLISLTWLRVGKHARTDTAAQKPAVQTSPAAPAIAARTAASPRITPRVTRSGKHTRIAAKNRKPANLARAASVAENDFVALPSFDPAIPVGPSRIVRMELPGSALQLVGYPVSEELLERRVLTDVLVGQDGVPYAVRLVQARAVH